MDKKTFLKEMKYRRIFLKTIGLLFVGFLCLIEVRAEEPFLHRIIQEEHGKILHYSIIYYQKEIRKTNQKMSYYWFDNGKMQSTQGDFLGNLLHGDYAELDRGGQLITKGSFSYGVKDGSWKSWDRNGKITEYGTWKRGVLIKKVSYTPLGTVIEYYRSSLLYRKKVIQQDGKVISKERYKNGIIQERGKGFFSKIGLLLKRKKGVSSDQQTKNETAQDK